MKMQLIIPIVAGMFLVTSCGALSEVSPTSPAASQQSASGQSTEPAWQIYTNAEAGFSISYPPTWQMEATPDENAGQLHRTTLMGSEGGLELEWGVGLGGACPQEYEPVKVAQGELPACHSQNSDGTEQWSLAGKQLGDISFAAIAHTSSATASSRDLVLKILSTLSFP
jgi:hypothetical protein